MLLPSYKRIALDFPEAPECCRFVIIAAKTIYENVAKNPDAKIIVLISRLPDSAG